MWISLESASKKYVQSYPSKYENKDFLFFPLACDLALAAQNEGSILGVLKTRVQYWECSKRGFNTGGAQNEGSILGVLKTRVQYWGCSKRGFNTGGAQNEGSILGVLKTRVQYWGCSKRGFNTGGAQNEGSILGVLKTALTKSLTSAQSRDFTFLPLTQKP